MLKELKTDAWSVTGGPDKTILPSFLYNKTRSWSESWDPESLETCQGDLLSCIEKTVDKESVVSQEGLLSMLCGCGEWEQQGMAHSLSSWYNLSVCVCVSQDKSWGVGWPVIRCLFYFLNAAGESGANYHLNSRACVCVCVCTWVSQAIVKK